MPRANRPLRTTTVVEVGPLTPSMVRVVLEGPDLSDFELGPYTDSYVKCRFGDRTRTYTVREFDPQARRLTLDFVVHGDSGLAGPWAAAARPGDTLQLSGPGGAYAPSPTADWHLMVGDEAVIPAITLALEQVPPAVSVFVLIEVSGPEHEQPLSSPGDMRVQWIHRTGGPGEDPELLLRALKDLDLPAGTGEAFVHGEAETVLLLRRHLLQERGLQPEQMSATGYWKLRRTDEEWRAEKREWITRAELDARAAAISS